MSQNIITILIEPHTGRVYKVNNVNKNLSDMIVIVMDGSAL